MNNELSCQFVDALMRLGSGESLFDSPPTVQSIRILAGAGQALHSAASPSKDPRPPSSFGVTFHLFLFASCTCPLPSKETAHLGNQGCHTEVLLALWHRSQVYLIVGQGFRLTNGESGLTT